MARKRVPLVLFDDTPVRKRKPTAPVPKPTPKVPRVPLRGGGTAPAHHPGRKVAPPPAKAPAPVQKKMDLKQAVAALAEPNPLIVDKPYDPMERGHRGPVPPPPVLRPKPPPPGTVPVEFKGGRMEITYKCRARVYHDTTEGTIVIEEHKLAYPEMEEPRPPPVKVQTVEVKKIEKPKKRRAK